MEVVHTRCAGLDVHKKGVYACVICRGTDGKKRQEIRSFGTMTADLLKLADWLREYEVSHVAFLEKFIQLPFLIPAPVSNVWKNFVKSIKPISHNTQRFRKRG
jgi:hypothetical protein